MFSIEYDEPKSSNSQPLKKIDVTAASVSSWVGLKEQSHIEKIEQYWSTWEET